MQIKHTDPIVLYVNRNSQCPERNIQLRARGNPVAY